MLSPWAGFVAGWMFLVSKIAAAGTVAIGLAGYLGAVLPGVPPRSVAVGAILKFAVTADLAGIDLQVVGVILMIIGVLGFVISLFFYLSARERGEAPRPPL